MTGSHDRRLGRFCQEMHEGDLIVMPLKSVRQFAVVEVTGP
ncbi:hypothetical protein [Amycolatopsis solani]|nr:hypothetical protein [Amycolatopsis sp. MEP2-6]